VQRRLGAGADVEVNLAEVVGLQEIGPGLLLGCRADVGVGVQKARRALRDRDRQARLDARAHRAARARCNGTSGSDEGDGSFSARTAAVAVALAAGIARHRGLWSRMHQGRQGRSGRTLRRTSGTRLVERIPMFKSDDAAPTRVDRLDHVAQRARELGRLVEHEPVAGVLGDNAGGVLDPTGQRRSRRLDEHRPRALDSRRQRFSPHAKGPGSLNERPFHENRSARLPSWINQLVPRSAHTGNRLWTSASKNPLDRSRIAMTLGPSIDRGGGLVPRCSRQPFRSRWALSHACSGVLLFRALMSRESRRAVRRRRRTCRMPRHGAVMLRQRDIGALQEPRGRTSERATRFLAVS
jgi:hypothetical protein